MINSSRRNAAVFYGTEMCLNKRKKVEKPKIAN